MYVGVEPPVRRCRTTQDETKQGTRAQPEVVVIRSDSCGRGVWAGLERKSWSYQRREMGQLTGWRRVNLRRVRLEWVRGREGEV